MKNKVKLILVAVFLIFLASFIFNKSIDYLGAQDDIFAMIAYVDYELIFNNHPVKAVADEKLNEYAQSLQSKLNTQAQTVPRTEQKELLAEYQNKLDEKSNEMRQKVFAKIEENIKELAVRKQLSMVLYKKDVIYGGYDLTDDLLAYIETKYKAID